MRWLLVFAAILSAQPVRAAPYEHVGMSNKIVVFLDRGTVEKTADGYKGWLTYVYRRPTSVGVVFARMLEEHDCAHQRSRNIYGVYYGADEQTVTSGEERSTWQPWVPETVIASVGRSMCSTAVPERIVPWNFSKPAAFVAAARELFPPE